MEAVKVEEIRKEKKQKLLALLYECQSELEELNQDEFIYIPILDPLVEKLERELSNEADLL